MKRITRERLHSGAFKAACVGFLLKAVEKTIPNEQIWWLAVGGGAVAFLAVGYYAGGPK